MKTLNPTLYQQVQKRFRDVRVANDGEAMQGTYVPDWYRGKGKLRFEITTWGESYRINCPFCSDTRHRLWISHRWAVRDFKAGDDNLHLATCFNDECLKDRQTQKQLHAMVFPYGNWADRVDLPPFLTPTPAPPAPPVKIELPAGISLDQLDADHPAIKYLRDRGFDPVALARNRGVTYCDYCSTSQPKIFEPRIVIPIYQPAKTVRLDGKPPTEELRLLGWQARMITSDIPDNARKYLNALGMKKNQMLYGLPQALDSTGPVVVVEGVTSAWAIGNNAVALLGKTASTEQAGTLGRRFPGRPIVVWLDPGAEEEAQKVRDYIWVNRIMRKDLTPVVIATTPPGREDPGACSSEEVANVIATALKEVSK